MGFELNRIMKQYGVSTPGMANYSGADAPTVPKAPTGDRPTGDDDAAKAAQTAFDKQKADAEAYKKDPSAFNEAFRKYGLDQTSYDRYKSDYQNRLQNTPMYLQSQFDTGYGTTASTTPTGSVMRSYADKPGGIGIDQANRNIQNWFAQNPSASAADIAAAKKEWSLTDADIKNAMGSGFKFGDGKPSGYGSDMARYANGPGGVGMDKANSNINKFIADNPYATTAQIKAEGDKWGVSNKDMYNATGSYYGNQLSAPTYGGIPLSLYNKTAQNKADYYKGQRDIGYTDADLRGAADKSFGTQKESDWTELLNRAYPQYVQNINDAYKTIGRSGFGANASNIDNPGYNFWMNQLSSGAIKPEDLSYKVQQAAIANGSWKPPVTTTGGMVGTDGYVGGTGGGNLGGINVINTPTIKPGEVGYSGGNAGISKLGGTTINGFTLPDAWDSFGATDKINWFNTNGVGTDTLLGGGYATQADIDWMKNNGYLAGNGTNGYVGGTGGGNLGGINVLNRSHGGSVHDLANKYAMGGQVKTHYQTAGAVKLPSGYGSADEEQDFKNRFFTPSSDVVINPVNMVEPPAPVTVDAPKSALTEIAVNNLKASPEPVAVPVAPAVAVTAPKAAAPFGDERMGNIQALLASYGPKDSAYAADLQTARAAAKAETDAFAKMLTGAMNSPEDAQSSKAEMYFRLAAAFGAPTKTGQFSENLGLVGKELGEYAKNKRAAGQQKLALGLEAQKLKMASSKEDLNTLRALSAEEMKDKRTIATELIKDYIKSGEPQSAAGKQALDEGLKPGTEGYQKRVAEIGNLNVEGKMAQITASLANMNTAAANLALAQEKFQNQKAQQAKLSPAEMKLKTETEDTIAQTGAALGTLKQAYALNPNTFDTSISDMAQRKALEVTNSKHPKVVATREQENLLEKAALAQLKSTFPGAISNDERKALQDVQGLGAKSIEERGKIMKNAYSALQSVQARHTKRLNDINQGMYRDTAAPIDGGND
jgi:hypothetical protein